MSQKNKQDLLILSLALVVTGCVTTNQSANLLDPYDPRNNIPLLQAATRTSGVNVDQKENLVIAKNVSGTNSTSASQKLREIKALRDEGVLTQKEYEAKKTEILKSM